MLLIVNIGVPVRALTSDDTFYGSNAQDFYDPEASSCLSNPAGVESKAIVKIEDTPALKTIFTYLISAKPYPLNSIQAAAVMGNMYWESHFDPSKEEYGNGIGYGLAQWSFERRTALEKYATQQGKPVSDVTVQLDYLMQEYNNNFRTSLNRTAWKNTTNVGDATRAWMDIFENPKDLPANDPAKLNSQRIPAANSVYELYKDLAPSIIVADTTDCGTENGVVAGNIVDTAINLALTSSIDNGHTSKADARDTYQAAKEQFNKGGDWSDCGVFVATVMISSGVDPDYVKVGVQDQTAYIRSHPEKYTVIENPKLEDLQPGDILLNGKHTVIYIGKTGHPVVDASLGERVPSVRPPGSDKTMIDSGAILARLIS